MAENAAESDELAPWDLGEEVFEDEPLQRRFEEALAEAESKGVRLIDKTPRRGAEGLTIAFLHPKSTGGVLTELCEDKNGK